MLGRIVRIVGIVCLAVGLVACGDTQQARQESADQLFGVAKVTMNVATIAVGAYNALCTDTLVQSSICASHINEQVNSTMAKAASAIKSAEAIFAAANSTQGERLDYAKGAMTAVSELTALVAKYGLSKFARA